MMIIERQFFANSYISISEEANVGKLSLHAIYENHTVHKIRTTAVIHEARNIPILSRINHTWNLPLQKVVLIVH